MQRIVGACLPLTFMVTVWPASVSAEGMDTPVLSEYHQHINRHTNKFRRALTYAMEEISIVLRGMYLAALFAPVVLTAPLAFYLGWGRAHWMELIRWTLESAGPAFIKWGTHLLPGFLLDAACYELTMLAMTRFISRLFRQALCFLASC